MKSCSHNLGYSTVAILVIIGFLMVLSVGVFNLVLREMQENRYVGDAIKAYAGAESAQELALLQIKKYGYGYYKKIDMLPVSESLLLAENPLDSSEYKKKEDVVVSYDIGSKVNRHEGILTPSSYHIIPLFYLDEENEYKVNAFDLTIKGNSDSLIWNVLSRSSGVSGVGDSNEGIKKEYSSGGENYLQFYESQDRNSFLSTHDNNYLILYNSNSTQAISYTLSSSDPSEYFTLPTTFVQSSAKVGEVRQNLSTKLDNTDYLGILKYVIYSD